MNGQWIPIEERRPNDGDIVLVYAGWRHAVMSYIGGGDWYEDSFLYDGEPPTHWMELPKAPEE